jgi:7-keto-8-aminopelargonate synthetase-like enzyme
VSNRSPLDPLYQQCTLDMFMFSFGHELDEVDEFASWRRAVGEAGLYPFENIRHGAQRPHVRLERDLTGETFDVLNFANYNYLGLGYHPEVVRAAQDAVARYGLGAACAPNLSGTLQVHRELEAALVDFIGVPDRGVTLFTSGYGANTGTIQALVQKGHHVVLDRLCHMSLVEGARTSGATAHYFDHNDPDHLDHVLAGVCGTGARVLVCVEGVYSADGDFGRLAEILTTTKRRGAYLLVDEAHSALLAGAHGRGVCEQAGILDEVDFYIATMSKSFSGVGGALIARTDVTRYVNWYAKCRLFSCALDPAVTGGMVKVLELARGPEGDARRRRLVANAKRMRELLRGEVAIGPSESWIVPVIFGLDSRTFDVTDFVQRRGLDASVMQFPSVPKNEARLRLFINSEHSEDDLTRAAAIVLEAADHFGFRTRAA